MPLPTYTHNGRTVWVKFNPKDDLVGLPAVFLTNPEKHIPRTDPITNRVEEWGTVEPDEEAEALGLPAGFRRLQTTQLLYPNTPTPEDQWTRLLASLREKTLLTANLDNLKDLQQRDLIFKVRYEDVRDLSGKRFCWRIVKAGGSMTLKEFADRVVLPAMGWCRGYHAYSFVDRRDGTTFGPMVGPYRDLAHLRFRGRWFLDDGKYTLAHLFDQRRVEVGFNYDLGDFWRHTITLTTILPLSRSTGIPAVLHGSGACPAKDCSSAAWQSIYDHLLLHPSDKKLQRTIQCAANYYDSPRFHSASLRLYYPHRFVLEEAQQRVADANSLVPAKREPRRPPTAWKDEATETKVAVAAKDARETHAQFMKYLGDAEHFPSDTPFLELESMRLTDLYANPEAETGAAGVVPDPSSVGAAVNGGFEEGCVQCGKEGRLALCGGCKSVRYCGIECQQRHWESHRSVCAKIKLEREKEREKGKRSWVKRMFD